MARGFVDESAKTYSALLSVVYVHCLAQSCDFIGLGTRIASDGLGWPQMASDGSRAAKLQSFKAKKGDVEKLR